ncbi:delta-1-pyrroline-5-carboxylate dehydrogenase, mitochondrial-like [Mizuhopecten yessoensis]|uniref:Multifunctional fusion protein n=1 Tax=Mizuhopecten yessoensis TaxID=6573 RepID=A0A210PKZ4_MIZYE|nr:delta-1-pyrroline-5-carboxylate dehydrogenase, mitochondrial-like [Mizuhopecten yessoensis]OWF37163.1 Delta-1-pyrroline-5-carboxylate dehydrogenase, mitochondrial [Mizuhopecten yessoensis]
MHSVSRFARIFPRCATSCRCLSSYPEPYVAVNEPMPEYAPGSKEKKELDACLAKYQNHVEDIPIVIGDEEIRTNQVHHQVAPFDHQKTIAKFTYASADLIQKGIDTSLRVRRDWERRPLYERAEIFLKAADLMSGKYRMDLLATTMMGQAKNVVQAEIDAAAELIDFLRFNAQFAQDITRYQPLSPTANITKNSTVYRGMEGFWAAITPFNFTAIGGHLASAPAMMGNVCQWKPSDTAMLSNYTVFKIFREAGVPAGVINFVPADGPVFGNTITSSHDLAGINFTGSVKTFHHLWKQVGQNLENFRTYPRLIGECGGKNFHFVHPTADVDSVVNGTVRSAFEFGGQKCSACSRAYIPASLWPKIKEGMINIHKQIKVGSPLDNDTFLSAVIDDKSFNRIKGYLDHAKTSPNLKVVAGGSCDDSKGYFVEPTIIETSDPKDKIMQEEIFGPVVAVYVYPDNKYKEVTKMVTETSPFALTGAIYAQEENVKQELVEMLKDSAGNFYINDKSTGSVVGQQPFGGARLSGTNDKAGGPHYLLKFVSVQSVKETMVPSKEWRYPSMAA